MDKPILIVGHGLAGCTLALTCLKRKIPFKIVGCSLPGEASMASSGLIAPITGRRYVKAWRIDEFLSKALEFYTWTEQLLGATYFYPVEIARYLKDSESRLAWDNRLLDTEYARYISEKKYKLLDELERPYGILTGGYRLDTQGWLTEVRNYLLHQGILEYLETPFVSTGSSDGITIFATGAVDATLAHRVIPNKGEALIVRMPEWKIKTIIKEDVFVIPLQEEHYYWIGSYYEPWPANPLRTEEGKQQLLEAVLKVYSGSLEVIQHLVGVRPTVKDRRPLIGALPGRPNQFIFNGMGTKGTSLAPYWAEQLVLHITDNLPLPKDVSPFRSLP